MRSVLICAVVLSAVGSLWAEEDEYNVPPDISDPFVFVRWQIIDDEFPTREELLASAARAGAKARKLLEGGDLLRARDACKNGLDELAKLKITALPELNERRAELLKLHAVAERLLRRREAEDAFRALNLRLSGIVSGERISQALINGATLARGDFVVMGGQRTEAQIEDIRKDEVVLRFRGVLMPLKLQ